MLNYAHGLDTLIDFRHRPTFIQRFIFKVNIRTRTKCEERMWFHVCNEGSVVTFSERVIDWSQSSDRRLTRNGD